MGLAILDSLALGGVEADSKVVARLASSAEVRSASMAYKKAIPERHVGVGRLFGAYPWDTLPMRYLIARTPTDKLRNMDGVAPVEAGKPWPAGAHAVMGEFASLGIVT